MPVYDYECESCGPFTFMRPMAQCDRPARCPQCGGKAPRAFLTAPYFATSAERRGSVSETGGAHNAGCSCCVPPPQPTSTRTFARSQSRQTAASKPHKAARKASRPSARG